MLRVVRLWCIKSDYPDFESSDWLLMQTQDNVEKAFQLLTIRSITHGVFDKTDLWVTYP